MPELPDQPLIAHLEALRNALLNMLYMTAALYPAAYWITPEVIDFLVRWSCPPEMGQLNYFTPMEVFIARLKLAFVLALAAAFPFNAWQLWRFLMPALYESERRALKWWIGASTLLFVMGAGFCLGTILPLLMRFSAGFATPNLKPVIGLAGFLELSGWLLLSFGLMFQFPLAVILAVRFGAVRVETLRRGRPYVVVGILILAAILTPPDVVSQLLLAVPTWILFEIGLLIAARQQKRREAAAAAELDDAVLDVYRQDNES
ncbi:MAG: twin-arginine translocase subunit TatC [Victivallis vadensis]